MATGINKLTRFARMYVDGYDLSGASRTFSSLDCKYDPVDLTGWSDAIYKTMANKRIMAGIRGYQCLMDDTATSGAFTILKSPDGTSDVLVSLLMGGGAAPAIGDVCYLLSSAQISAGTSFDAEAGILTADFVVNSSSNGGMPYGVVIHPATSLSSTTNGSSVDNAASSANGWHAVLHVTVSSGGEWAFTIEHSANDVDWATLGTFTALDGSAVGAEYQSGTGTVNQYVRFVATRTSGTVTPVCAFARK